MIAAAILTEKVKEITEEMQKTGVWKREAPGWVNDFMQHHITNGCDFCTWLQFIYLPNCGEMKKYPDKKMVTPQALKFFGSDVLQGRLLQLLVELDSL